MEKLMPIIPGCKALIAPGDYSHIGSVPAHEVKVLREYHGLKNSRCSVCHRESFWDVTSPTIGPDGAATCECQLTRIDGGDFEQETQIANKELWRESRLRQLEKNQAELDRLAKDGQFYWGLSTKQIQDQLRRNFG